MPTIRIMAYNILYGGVGREELLRDVVTAINPQIAIFTESTDSPSFNRVAEVVGPHRTRPGETPHHAAIVSQWPIQDEQRHGPPWAARKWVSTTIRPFDGPPLAVHGVHLQPQLFWPLELVRRYEVGRLIQRLRANTAAAQIVAGDFNALSRGDSHEISRAAWWVRTQWLLQAGATPRWALSKLTDAGFTDCYRALHRDADGFTMPSWDPQIRIDYLFASPSLRASLRSCETLQPQARQPAPHRSVAELLGKSTVKSLGGHASDHLPVWADFDWSDEAVERTHRPAAV